MAFQKLSVNDTHPLQGTTGILRSASPRQPLSVLKQDRRYSNLLRQKLHGKIYYLKCKVVIQVECSWANPSWWQGPPLTSEVIWLNQTPAGHAQGVSCKSFQQCHMHQTRREAMAPKVKLSLEGSSENKWWENGCFQTRVTKTVRTQRNQQSLKPFVSTGSENSLHKQKDVTPQQVLLKASSLRPYTHNSHSWLFWKWQTYPNPGLPHAKIVSDQRAKKVTAVREWPCPEQCVQYGQMGGNGEQQHGMTHSHSHSSHRV